MRILLLCGFLASLGQAQTLTPVWVELGPGNTVLARAVVENPAACPELRADGQALRMRVREPVPQGLMPVCEAAIPAGTRALRWKKVKLKLPRTPDRVIAIGDTGCRVRVGQVQACNDPELWPFASIAQEAAKLKPDLVVHVGDYLYRETACPDVVKGCAGPHGDNWSAWDADFFTPVRAALGSAPWIFARGNHESCERSFRGWFYYLDPRPLAAACNEFTEPYVAQCGDMRFGVLDTAATKDRPYAEPLQIPIFAKQLSQLSGRVDWIVDHHPFWGYTANKLISPTELTLGPAWKLANPQGISLVLSGHVHLFEFLALGAGRPSQVIAGDGGTQLDAGFTIDTSGSSITGARVVAGEVNLSFGLTELQRRGTGWLLTLRNAQGAASITCTIAGDSGTSCQTHRP